MQSQATQEQQTRRQDVIKLAKPISYIERDLSLLIKATSSLMDRCHVKWATSESSKTTGESKGPAREVLVTFPNKRFVNKLPSILKG